MLNELKLKMKVLVQHNRRECRLIMDTRVFSVFPACGKTWIFERQKELGITVLDSDSSEFSWCMRTRTDKEAKAIIAEKNYTTLSDIESVYNEVCKLRNPDFPKNYVEHIREKLGTCDYLFVSSHEEVRAAMYAAGIDYTLVYPYSNCLAEYVGRCYLREMAGTNGFPISVLINNWDKWIEQCMSDPGASCRWRLANGEYFMDHFRHLGGSRKIRR